MVCPPLLCPHLVEHLVYEGEDAGGDGGLADLPVVHEAALRGLRGHNMGIERNESELLRMGVYARLPTLDGRAYAPHCLLWSSVCFVCLRSMLCLYVKGVVCTLSASTMRSSSGM